LVLFPTSAYRTIGYVAARAYYLMGTGDKATGA